MPSARPALALGLALPAVVTLTLLGEARCAPPSLHDEGIILVEALRLRAGELPYRDYDPVYGPLEPGLLALAGPELLGLRLLRSLATAAAAASAALVAWRLGSPLGAVLAAGAVVAARDLEAHPAIAPALAACVLLDAAARRGDPPRWLLLAGACAGTATLLRAELGAVGLAAALAALVADAALRRELRAGLRRAGLLLLGALPPLLLAAGLVIALGPGRALAIAADLRACLPFRALPYPLPPGDLAGLPLGLVALAPLLAAGGGALVLGRQAVRRARGAAGDGEPPPARLALHAWALAVGLLPYSTWRPDLPHLFPALAASAGLLGGALAPLEGRLGPRASRGALLVACALLCAWLGGRIGKALTLARDPRLVASRLPGLDGLLVLPRFEEDYAQLREAVAPHPGPVFSGLGGLRDGVLHPEHDRLIANDALLYVVLGRPVAVRRAWLAPGITTTAAGQAELLEDLTRTDARVVVLGLGLWAEEPNRSQERGARLLDEALLARFRPAAMTRRFAVLVRR